MEVIFVPKAKSKFQRFIDGDYDRGLERLGKAAWIAVIGICAPCNLLFLALAWRDGLLP